MQEITSADTEMQSYALKNFMYMLFNLKNNFVYSI